MSIQHHYGPHSPHGAPHWSMHEGIHVLGGQRALLSASPSVQVEAAAGWKSGGGLPS